MTCQGPFPLSATKILVIVVFVPRLDVVVLEVLFLMDDGAAHARGFLGRVEQRVTVGAGEEKMEGEETP